jgi:hypothetical protein
MARRGSGGGGGMGGGGMMAPILSIATGLIIFVVLIIFAPTIAGSIQLAQPKLKEICSTCSGITSGGCAAPLLIYGQCGDSAIAAGGFGNYQNNSAADTSTYWSNWNATANTDIPNGVDIWTTNIQILGVVILIISIAVAMYFLKGMA